MEKVLSLTVILTTFNEEDDIPHAINSVKNWVDELIVVDSFSTDNTHEIVRQYENIKLFQRTYHGPAFQKNWAIPLAKHPWILLMDADERVTPALKQEIQDIFEKIQTDKKFDFDCFWIGFTHYFAGKRVKYSGWQNDKTIRLIKRDKCRYNQNRVHEEIMTEGLKVGFLKNRLEHFTFKSIRHFVDKQMRYAAWSAEDKKASTGKITFFHLLFKPFFRFFKHYILKKGFLDGYIGFMISAIAAWTVFMRYLHIYENQESRQKIPNS